MEQKKGKEGETAFLSSVVLTWKEGRRGETHKKDDPMWKLGQRSILRAPLPPSPKSTTADAGGVGRR